MVHNQMMNSGKRAALKSELDEDDSLLEFAPLHKRSTLDHTSQEGNLDEALPNPIPPSLYNPLDEPSPLGLSLKKSPSFLDLIQMRLSQENASTFKKKGGKGNGISSNPDKLKASNFPASLLKIGSWEYKSRYEGDLVAKCYFAKHKLVWEVLDGELKNKIEIQWSDIVAIKANYPDDGPGTLDVVLARQPLFFRETNPQPRKHTLWQATADFTGGQASIHRQHYLQCPQDLLGKHFEKLMQCDPRLNCLSQQPEIVLESPNFEPGVSAYNDPNNGIALRSESGPTIFGVQVTGSPTASQSSQCINEQDFVSRTPENLYQQTPSPCSVMDTHAIEEIRSTRTTGPKSLSQWDLSRFPGLRPSMSMSDLVNHIGHCISEQITSNNPIFSIDDQQGKDILEEITQYLLSDSQQTSASVDQSLMSRVNSLCCLLQNPSEMAPNLQAKDDAVNVQGDGKIGESSLVSASAGRSKVTEGFPVSVDESGDSFSCKQPQSMPRKDSVSDLLLLNLPRIASLPQFLFNIPEDNDNQARRR
ncbi:hypothetical protein SLE2022_380560 [Rubroshorea leprosula]